MVSFSGCCVYPHGGYASAGLLLSSCAALVCTVYAVASCKFVSLTFVSIYGSFEQSFARERSALDSTVESTVGLGLFTWLRPFGPEWDQGSCAGYQESMLDIISDQFFEMSRGFGVFAVLLSFGVMLWSFSTACLALNRFQINILRVLVILGLVSTGCSFLFLKTSLCTDQFVERQCEFDQGAYIMLAGLILWVVALLISVIFFRQADIFDDDDDHLRNAVKGTPARKSRSTSRSRSVDSLESFEQRQRKKSQRVTVDDVSRRNELEVYVSRKYNRMEQAMDGKAEI